MEIDEDGMWRFLLGIFCVCGMLLIHMNIIIKVILFLILWNFHIFFTSNLLVWGTSLQWFCLQWNLKNFLGRSFNEFFFLFLRKVVHGSSKSFSLFLVSLLPTSMLYPVFDESETSRISKILKSKYYIIYLIVFSITSLSFEH